MIEGEPHFEEKTPAESQEKSEKEIANAVKSNNFEIIASFAHKIKGGAAYCGAAKLKSAAIDLETAAKNNRKTEISELFRACPI